MMQNNSCFNAGLSANSCEREGSPGSSRCPLALSRGSQEGDLGLCPAPSFWASVLSPRQSQAAPSPLCSRRPPAGASSHGQPHVVPLEQQREGKACPLLPSCGLEAPGWSCGFPGRQAAAETAGSWRRSSAPPPEDSPFALIRSSPGERPEKRG